MTPEDLIPDFDEMKEMADRAARLKGKVIALKANISMYEAQVIKEAMTNRDHWQDGKRPGITYCQSVVSKVGNTDTDREVLYGWRIELAETVEELTLAEGYIQMMRDRLDLFRTLSANERKSFV